MNERATTDQGTSEDNCARLMGALAEIGKDEALRAKLLDLCREAEERLAQPNVSVRDTVTAPLIDALHGKTGVLRKTLSSGLVFDFHYRSKIAREFVMSPEARPDHVWEPQTTKLLVHLADGAENAVIGGAYFGDQAIMVARALARTDGVCHAFEPNRDQLAMLKRNAANNGLTNTVFNALGLWHDAETTLTLVGDDSFAHPEVVAAGEANGRDDVFGTTSINAYGAANGLENIGLIMLDIEGAEINALRGADRYLAQPMATAPHVVFEVHRHYVDWSKGLENTEIVGLFKGFGYHVFAVRDFNSNVPMADMPVELVPPERTYLDGPPHGFNMLAVKDRAVVESDFFKICVDVSPKLLAHKDPALHHPTAARGG